MPRTKAYNDAHKEESKAYYQAHKEEIKVQGEAYRATHKVEKSTWGIGYYIAHKEEILRCTKRRQQQIRFVVLEHYSHGCFSCAYCGEDDIDVLSIDHINDDGAKYRKIQGTGARLWRWLIKNNFPEGFQVLCRNCNWKKHL